MSEILLSGLSANPEKGLMIREIANVISQRGKDLIYPFALGSINSYGKKVILGGKEIEIVSKEKLEELLGDNHLPDIVIDYTVPLTAIENAKLYAKLGIKFVMGTTGFDMEEMNKIVTGSNISAVISPNMSVEIVTFISMFKYVSENFPNVFKGYTLEVVESHQSGKKDTSGTALTVIDFLKGMGVNLDKNQIKMVRDKDDQISLGVPKEYLGGHGYHTYTLKSNDGTVLFSFIHNVNGRLTYAKGTLDAVDFLINKNEGGGKIYTMNDVIRK